MKAVYKYPLYIRGNRSPDMPAHRIVHVGCQNNDPSVVMLWAEVGIGGNGAPLSPEAPTSYEVYGTGHPIPDDRAHVGSVIVGPLVWHVYCLPARPAAYLGTGGVA